MDKNKERIHWIDIARGMCIIAIVIGHVYTDGYLRWYLFSFHVPAFFYLSGLCFKENEEFAVFIIKRIKTIVVPYFFYSIISILIFWIAGRYINSLNEMGGIC